LRELTSTPVERRERREEVEWKGERSAARPLIPLSPRSFSLSLLPHHTTPCSPSPPAPPPRPARALPRPPPRRPARRRPGRRPWCPPGRLCALPPRRAKVREGTKRVSPVVCRATGASDVVAPLISPVGPPCLLLPAGRVGEPESEGLDGRIAPRPSCSALTRFLSPPNSSDDRRRPALRARRRQRFLGARAQAGGPAEGCVTIWRERGR